MLKPENRQAALAATARIACLVALTGCRHGGEDYAVAVDSGSVDSGAYTEDCENPLLECTQDWAVASYTEGADNSALESCCALLVEEVGYIYECCMVLDWEGTSCMAWGPPRPPAAGAPLRAAVAARAVKRAAQAQLV